jgi:hypothetical protein
MVGPMHGSKEVNISYDGAIWFKALESRNHVDNEEETKTSERPIFLPFPLSYYGFQISHLSS